MSYTMKHFFSMLTLMLPLLLCAQSEGYEQFETIYLKPDNQQLKELHAAMKAHNQTYHNSGPYQATVFSVQNGEMTGWLVWLMGPCTFAESDARPGSKEHDDDWAYNVMRYVKDQAYGEWWRRNDDYSVERADAPQVDKFYIRYMNVEKDQQHRVDGVMKKLSAAIKEVGDKNSWSVYDNMFRQGAAGRHMCSVSGFGTWAELDEDWKFKAAFEKVHGENTLSGFILEMQEVFSNSWDEIWTAIPELSGGGQ